MLATPGSHAGGDLQDEIMSPGLFYVAFFVRGLHLTLLSA